MIDQDDHSNNASLHDRAAIGDRTGRALVHVPTTYRLAHSVVVASNPTSPEAEAIGALRSHLLSQHVRLGRRGLAICAPTLQTGSTFVSVNLAVAMAQAGLKTLLIDGDMRRPSVHRMILPSREVPGLEDALIESQTSFTDAVQDDVLPNLSIIFSGRQAQNPQELLAGPRFKALIDRCMRDYELTIIDTPPSNTNADSRRIASVVRYAAIVARKDVSFISDIETIVNDLKSDQVRVIGTIMNEY